MAAAPLASSAPRSASATPHLRYLDGLRGVTALFVVLHHVFAEVCPNGDGAGLPRKIALLLHPLVFGHLAVGVFIVLSGFVLMLPVVRAHPHGGLGPNGLRGFAVRRARRILPPYYAALGFSLGLIAVFKTQLGQLHGVRWDVALPVWDGWNLLTHGLLVHNFSISWLFRINPPFWSIAVEWQIYWVFALLLFPLWKQTGYKGVWPVVVFFGAGPHFVLPPDAGGDWFCPWYLILFTMGMAAASLTFGPNVPLNLSRQTLLRRRAGWAFLVLAFLTVLTTCFGLAWWYENAFWCDLFLGGATAAFLVFAAAATRTTSASGNTKRRLPVSVRLLQSRVPLALGAFSYSLYLVHFPLLSLLHAFLRPHFGTSPLPTFLRLITLYILGVPLCLGAAYGFHRVFERPFLVKKDKTNPVRLKENALG